MYLVLFDIDGTLLHSQGLGSGAMERAGRRLLGPSFSLDGIDFGGALDPWIYREAATRMGRTDAHALHQEFYEAYLVELSGALERRERVPKIISGVETALRELSQKEATTLGLVTGNYGKAAPLKLRAAGLDPDRFTVGAFGDDGPTRPDLVRIAIERWAAAGGHGDCRRVAVVGDTPRDVDCAKKNGCRSVAVATGWHSFDALVAAGADEVVRDLTGLGEVLERLWAS